MTTRGSFCLGDDSEPLPLLVYPASIDTGAAGLFVKNDNLLKYASTPRCTSLSCDRGPDYGDEIMRAQQQYGVSRPTHFSSVLLQTIQARRGLSWDDKTRPDDPGTIDDTHGSLPTNVSFTRTCAPCSARDRSDTRNMQSCLSTKFSSVSQRRCLIIICEPLGPPA